MHTLKRAPQRIQSSHLCSQCRHATTVTRATAQRNQILRIRVQDARITRREDYLLGPLAPNRFAEDESYGCMQSIELESEKISKKAKGQSPYQAEQIKWKENMVWDGDRVVVVAETGPASRERGKVGTVIKVKRDTGVVEVEELNMVDIRAPDSARLADPSSPPIRTMPMPIPLSAVRVVYPLQIPPQTDSLGNTTQAPYLQDTIIDRLIRLPNRRGRFIANSNLALGQWVEIPKPPPRPRKDPNSKDDKSPRAKPSPNESDTLRYQVEEATWTPTLLRAPMPASIIDELRGKYSKHRTRHEPSYELMLENRARRKAEYAAFAKGGGGMLSSPAKEARKMEIAEMREKKGKPELKREILEKIGEVMKGKGVVMTGEREREVERNLKGEEALSASTRETETETETEGSHWVDEEIEDDEEVGEQGLEGATGELPVNDATIENEGRQQGLGDDRRP